MTEREDYIRTLENILWVLSEPLGSEGLNHLRAYIERKLEGLKS